MYLVEEFKIINIGIVSLGQRKLRKLSPKLLVVGLKMKEILKNFKKILRFFAFPQFLLNICGISASCSRVYTPGRYHHFSIIIFPISGGGMFRRPPPDATGFRSVNINGPNHTVRINSFPCQIVICMRQF